MPLDTLHLGTRALTLPTMTAPESVLNAHDPDGGPACPLERLRQEALRLEETIFQAQTVDAFYHSTQALSDLRRHVLAIEGGLEPETDPEWLEIHDSWNVVPDDPRTAAHIRRIWREIEQRERTRPRRRPRHVHEAKRSRETPP